MKAFVGLILNMGLVQVPEIKEYWSRDETPFFRRVFSRDRFHILEPTCGGAQWANKEIKDSRTY